MKGKLKKLIAGAAVLAMAAQFAFVLPASADKSSATDVYNKATFATGDDADWTKSADTTLAVDSNALLQSGGNSSTQVTKKFEVTQSNPIMYYDFTWNNGVSNGRAGGYNYIKIGDFELRAYGADSKAEMIIGGQTTAISSATVGSADVVVSLVIEQLTNKLTYNVTWPGAATPLTGTVSMTSGISYTDLDWGYVKPGRISSSSSSLKSFVLKAETDTREIRDITFTVEGQDTVIKVVDNEHVNIDDIPSYPLKLGGWKFTKWKDTSTQTEYTAQEIADLTITQNMTFVAQFEQDDTSVERMTSMEIKVHPDMKPEVPVKNDDGTDQTLEYPVELCITGEAGNEITSDSYQYPKGKLEVTWTIDGFNSLKGNDTGEPIENEDGSLVYCDSYMKLTGFTNNETKGTIAITSGIGNYFGKLKVHVKYGTDTVGYKELEDEFPLIIMADDSKDSSTIYPLGGYPENLNWYSDSLVGYKATDFIDNTQNPDPFLSGWCTWGGRSTKATLLQQEENGGDKYIYATGGTATNSSAYSAFEMGAVGEQAYVDVDVQFSTADERIALMDVGSRNADDHAEGDAYKDVAYKAVHTTPYRMDLKFDGSSLQYDATNTVTGIAPGTWYRVRISFDDSTQQMWYQVNSIDEGGTTGALLGKSGVIKYYNANTSLPLDMNYFVLCPATSGGIKIKNLKIYKPAMTSFTASAEPETITIPVGKTVTATVLDASKNNVKVTAEATAVSAEVTNKTSESENINAFVVSYGADGKKIEKITMSSAAIVANATKKISVTVPTSESIKSQKLFVWTDKMEPLINATEFTLDTESAVNNSSELTAIMKDADGNSLSGIVTWSLKEEYEGVTIAPHETDPSKAVITITGAAVPGEVVAVAANRGQSVETTVLLTGSADNVAFINPVTSVTIPFNDTPSTATYSAEVRTGQGTKIEDKTVTYAMYDSSNAQPLANTEAVSFDPETATLSVTKDAAGQIVYIRGTNTDGETISKSVKVTIHGLSFDFGASDEEGVHEGYTAVTPSSAYTESKGYGIAGNVTAGGSAATDDLNGDYIENASDFTFKVNVPRGKNYKLTVTYKGGMSTEYIDNDCSGVIRNENANLEQKTYNVAVIDDVLDFKITAGQIASVEIEMLDAKTKKQIPGWYTYGDSTTNSSSGGKVGWANRVQEYTTKFAVHNTAKSGSNPTTFYNNGYMDNILLEVAPGDLVTFNGMGTNSYTGNFKTEVQTLIQACRDRGAYVIMTTYTPHGPVPAGSSWASRYDSATKTFNTTRDTDGYTQIYREIAQEDSEVLVDFGKIANDKYNEMVKAKSTDAEKEAEAQRIISMFFDHNHYNDEMARMLAALYAPVIEEAFDTLVAE